MNCSLVSSDLLPGKLKNSAIMNPSSFSTVEILPVTLTQQELLRKNPAFGYGSAITAWLCYPVGWSQQISSFGKRWRLPSLKFNGPGSTEQGTCSLYTPSCCKSPPQLYWYWSEHAVRWNRKATKKPDLLPTDGCHRDCWSLWDAAFHGHSHLPRDLCGSWESGGWSRSNGPAGHGGLQGRLQEMENQKHWQLQMRAKRWSNNHSVGSKPEEKVYASMA